MAAILPARGAGRVLSEGKTHLNGLIASVAFERLQLVFRMLIVGIDLYGFAIVFDSELLLTILLVGFGQAVISPCRFGIFLDVELEDGNGIGGTVTLQ